MFKVQSLAADGERVARYPLKKTALETAKLWASICGNSTVQNRKGKFVACYSYHPDTGLSCAER